MEELHGDSRVRGVNLGGWLVIEGWIKPSLFDGILNGDMLVSFHLYIYIYYIQNIQSSSLIEMSIYNVGWNTGSI